MAKIQDGQKTKFDESENSEDDKSEGENGPKLVQQLATSSTHGKRCGLQNLQLNAHKAGMQGLDTNKINEIIQKASEGSRFYLHKQKRQKILDEKINEMKQQIESFSQEQLQKSEEFMNRLVAELESERNLTHTIVHVDMDMFYAAVEMRDDIRLRDKPMAVGGTGMLSTSNYAARKYGVRAAMPGFIGKKLCPELIIVPPNFTKYKEVSKKVQEVFAEYDPNFSPMSLDEAYLDITKYIINKGEQYEKQAGESNLTVGECIVNEMRQRIHKKTELTASAGIACNTRLAKVGSDLNKPNGQFYLPPDLQEIRKFVENLSIRKVCGIGNVGEQHLAALGITKCGQLWEKRGILHLLFSEISYTNFITIALGLGHNTLDSHSERERKSISCETTFKSTQDSKVIFSIAEEQCQELSEEMEKKEILGKVFTLKIKTADFQIKSRSFTLPQATNSYDVMISATRRLLQKEMEALLEPLHLRLLGVRMSSLIHASEVGSARQATITQLFSKPPQKLKQKIIENFEKDSSYKSSHDLDDSSNINNLCFSGNKENSAGNIIKEGMLQDILEVKEYECPVCKESIPVPNLFSFNKHVDKCLEESTSEPSSNLEKKTDIVDVEESEERRLCNSKNHMAIDENDLKNNGIFTFYEYESEDEYENYDEIINKNPNNQMTNLKHVTYGDSNLSDDSIDFSKTNHEQYNRNSSSSKPSSSTEQSYTCPVCQKLKYSNISNLNTHVDECLNRGTISELLESNDLGNQNSTDFITQPSVKRKFISDSKPNKKK
ncbi:unnamed protein product, partial [Meganyctiphanes norvegica]